MTSSVIYGITHRVDSQKFGEGRSSGGFSCLCSLAIDHSFFPLPMGAAIASCAAQTWLRWTAQVGTVLIDHLPQAPILPTISTPALLLLFEHKNSPPYKLGGRLAAFASRTDGLTWWTQGDSNPRPLACEANALTS